MSAGSEFHATGPEKLKARSLNLHLVLKIFIRILVKGNSNDLSSVRFVGQASRAYNKIGKHLVLTKCKTTSSEAALPNIDQI